MICAGLVEGPLFRRQIGVAEVGPQGTLRRVEMPCPLGGEVHVEQEVGVLRELVGRSKLGLGALVVARLIGRATRLEVRAAPLDVLRVRE